MSSAVYQEHSCGTVCESAVGKTQMAGE